MTPRLKQIVKIIRDEKISSREKRRELAGVAMYIFHAESCPPGQRSEEANFTPTKKEISVKDFIRGWGDWFASREIRWEDWSDICQEGLELTLKFIESDAEDYKELEECQKLIKKHFDRIDEIYKSDKYSEDTKIGWDDMGW